MKLLITLILLLPLPTMANIIEEDACISPERVGLMILTARKHLADSLAELIKTSCNDKNKLTVIKSDGKRGYIECVWREE